MTSYNGMSTSKKGIETKMKTIVSLYGKGKEIIS